MSIQMHVFKILSLSIPLFLCSINSFAQSVIVEAGQINGVEKYGIKHFLGVPYAKPPLGDLRWQAPKKIIKYNTPINASVYGDQCMQPNAKPENEMSEDCLNLNIWTPTTANKKLPVMVWLHGGGFKNGSNRVLGTTFAAKGVVVVALNYRLGPLGFFAHKALSEHPANPGLLDMVAGIQWVKDNIKQFGGDPDNITIFGVSAGGMAVNLMITSELTKGLFHKAIAQSGYATWPLPRTKAVVALNGSPNAEQMSNTLISTIINKKQTKHSLYELNAKMLVDAVEGFVLPIVDGQSLIEEPGIRYLQGQQNAVDLITGGNSFEGSVMPYSGMSEQDYKDIVGLNYNAIKALYTLSTPNLNTQQMWGDNRYLLSAKVTAGAMDKVSKSSWLYYVDFVPKEFKGTTPGTTHGSDAQMIWGGHLSKSEEIKSVSLRLQNYWMNFAKYDHPTPQSQNSTEPAIDWTRYSKNIKPWLLVASQDKVVSKQLEKKLSVLESVYLRRVTSLVD
ncbi:MAG: para-nitrobenzyl esterase [Paraglaciecola sp.]|jgi:para-nitrobenzyl esterase